MDSIFDKIDSMNQFLREENLNDLNSYRRIFFQKLISEMNEPVKENEKLLKSVRISEVNKYKSKLEDYQTVPEKVD